MNDFISYLDEIESLVKAKQYDEAWSVANEGLIKIKGEDKYMMYYQMANIVAREKKWFDALEKMGFVIYYLKGLGGVSHKKFVLRLLKKFKKEASLDEYLELVEKTHPRDLLPHLKTFLEVES